MSTMSTIHAAINAADVRAEIASAWSHRGGFELAGAICDALTEDLDWFEDFYQYGEVPAILDGILPVYTADIAALWLEIGAQGAAESEGMITPTVSAVEIMIADLAVLIERGITYGAGMILDLADAVEESDR